MTDLTKNVAGCAVEAFDTESRNACAADDVGLPEPYREVLLLRDIEELDTDQTAQQLGTTPGAVKTRLHRARQALRALLEPWCSGKSAASEPSDGLPSTRGAKVLLQGG